MNALPPTKAVSDHVADLRARVDEELSDLVVAREPASLYEPVEYVLQGRGKRIRPALLLLVAEAFDCPVERSLPAALAVEVFHNFTLVHDDIMDQAQERRGRPTVHEKWDEDTAILTGNLMMGLSYELLGRVKGVEAVSPYDIYHPMVEQLCTGQALDASFEDQDQVSVDAYLDMIDRKTAVLLATCFELGALVGGASASQRRQLRCAGRLVGRAFQIQDDLLDLTAEGDAWGKAVGGDLITGKKTFITLRALEQAEGPEYDWFARLVKTGGLPPEDVPEARDRMKRLGVFQDAREAVRGYTDRAQKHLQVLPEGHAAESLRWLTNQMEARNY